MLGDLLYDIRKFYDYDPIVHGSGSEQQGDAHTSCSKRGNICRAFVLGLCPKWSKKIQTVLCRSLREVLPKVRI